MDLRKVQEVVWQEQWNLGFINQAADDIVRNGINGEVKWLRPQGRGAVLADPSCLTLPDGTLVLLAERVNYWTGRGEIWSAVIPPGGNPAEAILYPWITAPVHLSYPFAFKDEHGNNCLTVESWEANAIFLWRELHGEWTRAGPIMNSRAAVDPTFWRANNLWWLFCTFQDALPNEHLYLFYAERLEGPWVPHAANPVKRDVSSSRPAGPLFVADGMTIRPAQDCSERYGGSIVLNVITRLDPQAFEEEPLRRLEPFDISYPHLLSGWSNNDH